MEQTDLLRIARRRASAKLGFFIHLTAFVAVNVLLFVINQRTSPGVTWFAFPLGGWAVGLAIHGLAIYLPGTGLRQRLVESELRKLQSGRMPGAQ